MLEVKENENGSFEITWDPDDPVESVFNTWSEEDFTKCIMDVCRKVIEETEVECKKQLEEIAAKLGGKLEHYVCSDLHNQSEKYVITYNHQKKNDPS
jgi:predicted flavoprotein YhiN